MKNTNKKIISTEQKIYTVLIGLGICALAVVTIIYGVRSKNSSNLVDQSVQMGDENPVSGPVAQTAREEDDTEAAGTESSTEKNTEAEAKESMASVTGYNGTDKLAWPVTGNVIIPYSMDTTVYFETLDHYQCNPALYIKADVGSPVKAVYGGTVSSVTENDRYGHMITIDMGNGYKMSYGQLGDITFEKGDVVETGAQLGTIAEPTDYFMLEGSHLYMKMTLNGKEVNPTEYLEP